VVDRRFWVADGRRADFEKVFAVGGIWNGLLRNGEGYLFTEVWCEVPELRQYRVRDSWSWHRDFESFRARFQLEYERFENWIVSERLIEKQEFLGAYYEKRGYGDEDDWVLG
jgi:hypothetical protein